MPIYVFECPEGHRFDKLLKIEQYLEPQECECGSMGKRVITPTMLSLDIAPWDAYVSPATGKYITSHKERKRDMKESGCVDYEPSLKKHNKEKQKAEDLKLDKKVDETVDRIYENLPSKKRESLSNELTRGTDLQYTRGTANG